MISVLKRIPSVTFRISCKTLHILSSSKLNKSDVKEIKIPVPWGHIAGKWWGGEHQRPILAVHGWQDNAGSFDALLELFPNTLSVLAIDLPGHGFSSHIPQGCIFEDMFDSILIRRIQKYYNWDKVTLLGHSRGAHLSMVFSALYPDDVDCLVSLDLLMPFMDIKTNMLNELIDKHLANISYSSENKEYTEDEVKSRWIKATRGSLNEDSVSVLMKRAVKLNPETGKISLTRDYRLKIPGLGYCTPEISTSIAENMKCHYLVIKFGEGMFLMNAFKYIPNALDIVKKSTRSFEYHEIKGTHHEHMRSPEIVVPIIMKFLERVKP